jgi:hypothetical protein
MIDPFPLELSDVTPLANRKASDDYEPPSTHAAIIPHFRSSGGGPMPEIPVRDREHHCFISYASEDAALARRIADWLSRAGLRIWLDQLRFSAGATIADELAIQISKSRCFLVLLTPKALEKSYVRHEVQIASDERIEHQDEGFRFVLVRTDPSLDPASRFPNVKATAWLELPNGDLTLDGARQLLLSVTPPVDLANDTPHVFVSCGWGPNDKSISRQVCALLAERGVRLVGDATDQKTFGEDGRARVQRIMSGCTGHVMVLPVRRSPGKSVEESYKYFLAEWEISRRLRLARQTFCVSRSALPPQLQSEAVEIGDAANSAPVERELSALYDETEPVAPYAFLATDYKRNIQRNEAARDVIEHVLGMKCWLGKDYPSEELRKAIIEKIINANLVFADLACSQDDAKLRLQPNLNTCIEAGIAMGAGRPVFLTALDPESFDPKVQQKTTQIPFMFRNSQVNWYQSVPDFLAQVHKLAMATRRRIINDELR